MVGFAALALFIVALAGGLWALLINRNLTTSPTIPWSVPAMAVVLWLMWQYLDGKWWPRSTSAARRRYLRANPVSGQVFAAALLAGVLSIVALAGYWIVLFQLVRMPANVLPDYSKYPLLTVALAIVMGSLVAPLSEEAAFRGYFQVLLESEFRASAAVVISSVLFALAHFTQGFFWPKLLIYFLVGVVFGLIAYCTNSILPGILVHIIGDLAFFTLIWPHDATRRLVWDSGTDPWFWIPAVQAIVFTALAILAFTRLARVTERVRAVAGSRIRPASA